MSTLIKSKRGQDFLAGPIIFIVLNVLFFSLMFAFITTVGNGSYILEKVYAKQIALTIDYMKPGTEATLSLPKLFELAAKNKAQHPIVTLDYDANLVKVNLGSKDGSKFYYFTKLKIGSLSLDEDKQTITIKT